LLICVLYPLDKRMSNWKFLRPITYCGGMSYSIYLMHPVITKAISHGTFLAGYNDPWTTVFVVVPLCLAVSLAAAKVFNYFVERHFINPPSEAKPSAKRPATEPGTTLVERLLRRELRPSS